MSEEIISASKWSDLVAAVDVGNPVKFPVKHKSTVRFEISNNILKAYPCRKYKTWTDNETITVYRIK